MKKLIMIMGMIFACVGCSTIHVEPSTTNQQDSKSITSQSYEDDRGNHMMLMEDNAKKEINVRNYKPLNSHLKDLLTFEYSLRVLQEKFQPNTFGCDMSIILTTKSERYDGKYHSEQPIIYSFGWDSKGNEPAYMNIHYGYDSEMDSAYDPLSEFTEQDAKILYEEFKELLTKH